MNFLLHDHQRRLGMAFAFGAVLWSGTYNALAKGLTPYVSPMTLLILSETLTAVFIILTFGLVPLVKKLAKLDARSIVMCIVVGLLNSAIAPLLWFHGLARTSAINASMLSTADILCVLFLGAVILRERVTRMQVVGGLTVFVGIVIINVSSTGESMSIRIGDMLILAGAITSGFGSILFKKYLSNIMPELAIAIRNIAAIVAVGIASVLLTHSVRDEVAAFPLTLVLPLLMFTFFSRYLNLTFYYEALERLPATTFSLILIATPFSGLMFASLFLGERIYAYHILGGIFIIFGLALEQISAEKIRLFSGRHFLHVLPFRKTAVPPALQVLPRNV